MRRLIFTMVGISVAAASVAAASVAAEKNLETGSAEARLEMARGALDLEIRNLRTSPEERALLIETWNKDNRALMLQAEAERRATRPEQPVASPIPAAPEEPLPTDPVLADIHEIEREIGDFRKSLTIMNLTPEQRAVQIEQFHQINRETLRHLDVLKRQAASQIHPSGVSAAEESGTAVQVPAEIAGFQAEIARIMRDLAHISPEIRAEYIQAHAETIRTMENEMTTSFASPLVLPTNTKSKDTP